MELTVRLHRRARRDLADIREFIVGQADTAAADRVRRHLGQRIASLGKTPAIGISTSDPRIRVLSPTRFPYRIYFTVTATAVVVLHIRHTARATIDPADP